MKVNCDWLKDKYNAWKEKRYHYIRAWHPKFKIYVRLGKNDCRIFETVERILVRDYESRNDHWSCPAWKWAYRAINKLPPPTASAPAI